ncbi:MAG: SLC13 family permease [Elusimicrobiota bacterium]
MDKILAIAVFALCYAGIILKKDKKEIIVILSVALLFILRIVSFDDAYNMINWRVIAIFTGTFLVAEVFTGSGVPLWFADHLVNRSRNVGLAFLFIVIITGVLSGFLENVTTVLIMAPIAFALCERQKISPVNVLIGLAVSSNLQGTATLIGDSPSIILGSFADMGFNDFFFFRGRPGIFFAVEVGAVVSFIFLYMYFRKYKANITKFTPPHISDWIPTGLLFGLIATLIVVSYIYKENKDMLGYVCLGFGLLAIIWESLGRAEMTLKTYIKKFDWHTLIFLLSIFILIGALTKTGLINDLGRFMASKLYGNNFIAFTVIVWMSVVFSAFIDNVPYVLAMLPAVKTFAVAVNALPYVFYFGLLIGASIGGNITPIGASANVVAIGLLKKKGYAVSFWEFVKIGFPFTILATGASYIFLWIFWRI